MPPAIPAANTTPSCEKRVSGFQKVAGSERAHHEGEDVDTALGCRDALGGLAVTAISILRGKEREGARTRRREGSK